MRVVHLSSQHPPHDVRIFHKECRSLAAEGLTVDLVIRGATATVNDGVHLHPFAWPGGWLRPARIGRRLWRMYRAARALEGDVYHFHDPELILVGLLLKRDGARVIYDVHEDTPREALAINKGRPIEGRLKSWAWSSLESIARRVFDAFICATPAIARNFPPGRTFVVQNYPLLAELGDDAGHVGERPADLAYVGTITQPRGVGEMVDALALLPASSPTRLRLAGEFKPPELLRQMASRPGWDRVDFRGQLDRPGVRRLLAGSRAGLVLFHPERDHLEAMPNKLFEYMAAGLPVIASDFPLWRQIVEEAGCGMVVDPLQPRQIVEAVRRLFDHPAEAAAMGRRGQAVVRQRYNWEAESRKLIALYHSLRTH